MPYAENPGAGTHFLVDLENTHARWTRIFPDLKRSDKISIFVSVPAHTLDILELAATGALDIPVYFNLCENGRPNAMDFQIMCELGRLSVLEPGMKYVLVTDDQCYRSVIKYMADRNIRVEMFCPNDPGTIMPAQAPEPEPVSKTYRRMLASAGVTDIQDLSIAAGILSASMGLPQNRRKADCHNRFLKRYGRSEGELRYRALKDVIHKIANEGPWPKPAGAVKASKPQSPTNMPTPAAGAPAVTSDAVNKLLSKAFPLSAGDVAKAMSIVQTILQTAPAGTAHDAMLDRLQSEFGKTRGTAAYTQLKIFLGQK